MGLWSMDMVRRFGGVVEHPLNSGLWRASGCLGFGIRDDFDGVLVPVLQSWWGHRAPKASGFYFVGPLPSFPDFDQPPARYLVEYMGVPERERTPPDLAIWLVAAARACGKNGDHRPPCSSLPLAPVQ